MSNINFANIISTSTDLLSYMTRRELDVKTIEGLEPVIEISTEDAELLGIMAEESKLRMERSARKSVRTQQMRKAGKNRRRDGKVRHNGRPLPIKVCDYEEPQTLKEVIDEWSCEMLDKANIFDQLEMLFRKNAIDNIAHGRYIMYQEKLVHLVANMPLDEVQLEWDMEDPYYGELDEFFGPFDWVNIRIGDDAFGIYPSSLGKWEQKWLYSMYNNGANWSPVWEYVPKHAPNGVLYYQEVMTRLPICKG